MTRKPPNGFCSQTKSRLVKIPTGQASGFALAMTVVIKLLVKKNKEMHFAAKIIGIVVALALALFVGITALGIYWPNIQEYRYKLEAERFKKEVDAEKKRIADLEKADTFGGKTPEETFDMFLDALKKNDADLAAKYYDVRVQEDALNNLKKELSEKGNLGMSLAYFEDVRKGEKKCNEKADGCTFEYVYKTDKDETVKDELGNEIVVPKGEERNKFIDFKNNQVSGLWKATQPF